MFERWGCSKCGRTDTTKSERDEDDLRRERNCDGRTNDILAEIGRPLVGPVPMCPHSIAIEAHEGFRWWADYKRSNGQILPFSGSFNDQPYFVCQALRAGDGAYLKAEELVRKRKGG